LRNDFTFGDLVQNIPKIMHMFRTYTNASLAKMNAEKTSAEGNNSFLIFLIIFYIFINFFVYFRLYNELL